MRTLPCSFALFFTASALAATAHDSFSLAQVASAPYPSDRVAAKHGNRIAWVLDRQGVRNIWIAEAPAFTPREVTKHTADDGQELIQLSISPDGAYLVHVRVYVIAREAVRRPHLPPGFAGSGSSIC